LQANVPLRQVADQKGDRAYSVHQDSHDHQRIARPAGIGESLPHATDSLILETAQPLEAGMRTQRHHPVGERRT
jgi:hypothetical protein